MAINQDVQDLINYPGTVKRITIDVDSIVPTGTEGDEKMMLTASTAAYSDNTNRTAIQDLYIMHGYVGWAKSTGLAGSAGKFALDASHCKLGVSMDATVSGTYSYSGKAFYEITLSHNSGIPKSGEDIATDMQEKLRAITCNTADEGFQLAYTNCSVAFKNGKFYISSGTIADYYTGSNRTSVTVAPAQSEDCSAMLGFDHTVTSEDLAGLSVTESALASDYTADSSSLVIGPNTGVAAGDALYITDGTNEDYFTAITASGINVTVATNATNGFTGIANSYAVADGSFVQILKKQDPDAKPNSYFDDVDGLLRYMTKCLVNQIDFSS